MSSFKVLDRKDSSLENRITTMGFLARAKCVTDIDEAIRLENEAMQLCRQLNKPATTSYIWSIRVLPDYYHHRELAGTVLDLQKCYRFIFSTSFLSLTASYGALWCKHHKLPGY
ncbi:hypothetical protein [Chitinophaga sp. YR627]|uniref:hypothetical protein n=1 Tax=Chitinophaga sp. YR627 TaxID=1881041 RepID=UPI000A66C1BD|nr:hypothetical protein [Chitinophaga sp. YR627]